MLPQNEHFSHRRGNVIYLNTPQTSLLTLADHVLGGEPTRESHTTDGRVVTLEYEPTWEGENPQPASLTLSVTGSNGDPEKYIIDVPNEPDFHNIHESYSVIVVNEAAAEAMGIVPEASDRTSWKGNKLPLDRMLEAIDNSDDGHGFPSNGRR